MGAESRWLFTDVIVIKSKAVPAKLAALISTLSAGDTDGSFEVTGRGCVIITAREN